MSCSKHIQDDPLIELYRQIADTAANDTPDWPASRDFVPLLDCCTTDHNDQVHHGDATAAAGICTTKYRARRFEVDGPFGLVALITHEYNPDAVPLIHQCLDCFDMFVQELLACSIITATAKESTQSPTQTLPTPRPLLHIIPRSTVPHICVFMVHEHASLLQAHQTAERDACKPVDDHTMQRLIHDDVSPILEAHLSPSAASSIFLQLERILLTPDGAMIAGFVDVSQETHTSLYHTVKMECIQAVRERTGTLTSRPKNLIHVTLGRVLGFGRRLVLLDEATTENEEEDTRITPEQQQQVCQLVKRFNEHVLPHKVLEIQRNSKNNNNDHLGGIFRLQHVSMLRNTVWLCEENIIYKTWHWPTSNS